MEKLIRTVDKAKGIVQVTTIDERWYVKPEESKTSGIPEIVAVPSVTWIAGHYPKGIGFYKWLADKGWDESEAIKSAAGDKGSKVHKAIEHLIKGETIKINDKFENHSTGLMEELSLEEYTCIMSFGAWFKETKPEIIKSEEIVWNDTEGYAGTVDIMCKIDDEYWIVDIKTSKQVWPEHMLQVSAYKHALPNHDKIKLGILQVGYNRNKAGFKFTEVEDKYDLFLSAKTIWKHETDGVTIKQKDYPLTVSLNLPPLVKKTVKKAQTNVQL
jgi:hypothetical protein